MWARKRLVGALVAFVIVGASASAAVAGTGLFGGQSPTTVAIHVLRGTVPSILGKARQLGTVSSKRRIAVVLPLVLPNRTALNTYVAGEYTPGSRDYHEFLKPAAFGRRFGASAGQVDQVVGTLDHLGLTASSPGANRLFVSAVGSVGTVERAFGVHLANFSVGSARLDDVHRFFSNVKNIELPGSLHGLVSGVIGLNSISQPKSNIVLPSRRALIADEARKTTKTTKPQVSPTPVAGGATPCAAADASGGYTAPDLANAYNFDGLYTKGFSGQGMSAALIEYDDFHDSNVATMEGCYGVKTPVTRRLVDGGTGGPPAAGEAEDMADITTILEMDPDLAHLYVYEAPINGEAAPGSADNAEIDLFNAFVTDDVAPVLSSSWGNCEELQSGSYDQLFGEITEEAAAQGQQIFEAAGDSGAVDCRGYPTPTSGSISVEQEAADPWVTGVGGTDLSTSSIVSGGPHGEATWNDGGAGGGGQSEVWPMPAYQSSYLSQANDTPAGENATGCDGGPCRMVPDISLDADPDAGAETDTSNPGLPQFSGSVDGLVPYGTGSPGLDTYCATPNCSFTSLLGLPATPTSPLPGTGGSGSWYPIGGTSLATPTAAAAAVLWDQEAKKAGLSGLGFLNPSMYRIAENSTDYANDFYNIAADGYNGSDGTLAYDGTGETNDDQYDESDCPTGCNPNHLYAAGTGYNMASGLGAINAANLGANLVADAGSVDLTPSTVSVYGYTNGSTTTTPVSVTSGYTGSTFTATSNASWLHVTSSGKVPSTLSWYADPAGLSVGTYNATITVRDAGGKSATLSVNYQVTPAATLSVTPSSLAFSEYAIDSSGDQTTAACNDNVWSDELIESTDFDGGDYDGYTPDPDSLSSIQVENTGPANSVLHYAVYLVADTSAWLNQDLNPNQLATGFQTSSGQALVPTTGSLASGDSATVKLASLANGNALGGYPDMNQGTYTGEVEVEDLADQSVIKTVPVTLTLGTGQGTPTIATDPTSVSVTLAPGKSTTKDVILSDSSGTCGYAYSVSTGASWATINPYLAAGTVAVPAAAAAPSSPVDTGSGNGYTPITISAAGLKAGTYETDLEVQSQNAAADRTKIPITLTVTGSSTTPGGGSKPGGTTACSAKARTLRFHPRKHVRVTKARFYVNGKLSRTYRSHNLRSIIFGKQSKAKFSLKILSYDTDGEIWRRTATYSNCRLSHIKVTEVHKATKHKKKKKSRKRKGKK
jgi:Pro-kumamolisin, activation domain